MKRPEIQLYIIHVQGVCIKNKLSKSQDKKELCNKYFCYLLHCRHSLPSELPGKPHIEIWNKIKAKPQPNKLQYLDS